ncbi:cystathionine gamma-synthase family protein [Orrella sp. 11846]|uniref:cystathionine gamma-synthase family protein n=1 Tax=Orrella sp. 11846 TaxID=3409913 RepID=UPI003B5B8C39
MSDQSYSEGLTTRILHADRRAGAEHGAVHKPMHSSSQYAFEDAQSLTAVFQGQPGFSYARQGTPTTAWLERKLTLMENAQGSVVFSTGMAALAALFTTLLKAGDHVVASQNIFGNTNSLFGTLRQLGVEVTLVDATDARNLEAALQDNTRLLFVETIANPGTQVADLIKIGELAKAHQLLYVVDSTLTTPWLLQGRDINASLVVHSLSKHIAGQAQALGGVVIDTGCFDWEAYDNILPTYRQGNPAQWGLTQIRKKGLRDMGATLAAEPAHRISLGAETMALRLARGCDNAMALAQMLEVHPGVQSVAYPGLASHAQHERATTLFGGRYGTLLSFVIKPELDCLDVLNRLKIAILATHLGDTRTLCLPAALTIYHEMGPAMRAQMGISDNLIRVSVGIEDEQDLLRDFSNALEN